MRTTSLLLKFREAVVVKDSHFKWYYIIRSFSIDPNMPPASRLPYCPIDAVAQGSG
jgi:hypothetical protein